MCPRHPHLLTPVPSWGQTLFELSQSFVELLLMITYYLVKKPKSKDQRAPRETAPSHLAAQSHSHKPPSVFYATSFFFISQLSNAY